MTEKLIKCYDILEVSLDASLDDIKSHFGDLVSVWHPDRFSDNPRRQNLAQEKTKQLNEAYNEIESYFKTYGKPQFLSSFDGEGTRGNGIPVEIFQSEKWEKPERDSFQDDDRKKEPRESFEGVAREKTASESLHDGQCKAWADGPREENLWKKQEKQQRETLNEEQADSSKFEAKQRNTREQASAHRTQSNLGNRPPSLSYRLKASFYAISIFVVITAIPVFVIIKNFINSTENTDNEQSVQFSSHSPESASEYNITPTPEPAVQGALSSSSAVATIQCSDIKYGNDKYAEKMNELAKNAKLPDNYYSKYHEGVVSGLCGGDIKSVDETIDYGYVKANEVIAISQILGKPYKVKKRSKKGKLYADTRNELAVKMSLCSACEDNVTQHLINMPSSKCSRLAKQALGGDLEAKRQLEEFPDYCKWEYVN